MIYSAIDNIDDNLDDNLRHLNYDYFYKGEYGQRDVFINKI